MTNNDDKPQTFFDAQVAFARSKHGKAQKQKDKHGYRYQQNRQAATRSENGELKEIINDND